MEICKDCKGTGTIQLFSSAKPCVKCGGTGKAQCQCATGPDSCTVTFSGIVDCNIPPISTPTRYYPSADFSTIQPVPATLDEMFSATQGMRDLLHAGAVKRNEIRAVDRLPSRSE